MGSIIHRQKWSVSFNAAIQQTYNRRMIQRGDYSRLLQKVLLLTRNQLSIEYLDSYVCIRIKRPSQMHLPEAPFTHQFQQMIVSKLLLNAIYHWCLLKNSEKLLPMIK